MPITYEHRVPAATLGGLALAAGQKQDEAKRGLEERERAMKLAQMAQQQQMQNQRLAYNAASTQYRTAADYNKFVANAQITQMRDAQAQKDRMAVLGQQDVLAQGRMHAQWDHAEELGQREDLETGLRTRLTEIRGMVNEDGTRIVDGLKSDYLAIQADPRLSPGQKKKAYGVLNLKLTDSNVETEYAKEPTQEVGVPYVVPGTGRRMVNLPGPDGSVVSQDAGEDHRSLPEFGSLVRPDGGYDKTEAHRMWLRHWGSVTDTIESGAGGSRTAVKVARWTDGQGKTHEEKWVEPEEAVRVQTMEAEKHESVVAKARVASVQAAYNKMVDSRPQVLGKGTAGVTELVDAPLEHRDTIDYWGRALNQTQGKAAEDAYLEENGYIRTSNGNLLNFDEQADPGGGMAGVDLGGAPAPQDDLDEFRELGRMAGQARQRPSVQEEEAAVAAVTGRGPAQDAGELKEALGTLARGQTEQAGADAAVTAAGGYTDAQRLAIQAATNSVNEEPKVDPMMTPSDRRQLVDRTRKLLADGVSPEQLAGWSDIDQSIIDEAMGVGERWPGYGPVVKTPPRNPGYQRSLDAAAGGMF